MTDDEIKAECERRFQSGGTRTQMVKSPRGTTRWEFFASFDSVPHARSHKEADDRIFARRRTRNPANGRALYVWKEFK